MKIIKKVVVYALAFFIASCLGCSENARQDSANKTAKSDVQFPKLQLVQADMTNAAACVTACRIPRHNYLEVLVNSLSELSQTQREEAFDFATEVFSCPKIKKFPLSQRQRSIYVYIWIVKNITVAFADKLEEPVKVWRFLLKAISVFDRERDIVSAPDFDPQTPPMGLHITKGMYVDAMDSMKFDAIREGFEENLSFMKYYNRLPVEQQKEWIDRLQKVAGRKVVIYNPDDPTSEPPKRRITIPSHLPPQVQEKMRAIRREALIKAGIDPATEGL